MFTKRIIPCLDVTNGRVVKGVNFVNLKDAGDPVEIAKAYDKAGADELVFLDITASSDSRAGNIDHFYDALTKGGAEAALAASLFHYKELEIEEVKRELKDRGLSMRI